MSLQHSEGCPQPWALALGDFPATTTLTDFCFTFFVEACVAQVSANGAPLHSGNVNFSFQGGPTSTVPIQNQFGGYYAIYGLNITKSGTYTTVATFPAQGNYLSSTTTTTFTVNCFDGFCFGGNVAERRIQIPLNAFSGIGLPGHSPIRARRPARFNSFLY